jgi:DNA-binding MarR family transcriptional regulator
MQDRAVERIRKFNRFYTNLIGVLDRHILESPLSLSEARVLYELNNQRECTARDIMQTLNIDEGYLSRIIHRFIKQGMIKKVKSEADKRAYILTVTPKGKNQFQKINNASISAISELLTDVDEKDVQQLVVMMDNIERILSTPYEKSDTE